MGTRTVQNYSVNQEFFWVPRKPGTYKVSILVKSDSSFGKYDAINNFNVIVK